MLVVKLGGAAGVDFASACADIAALVRAGERVVVVHGGSEAANALGEQVGEPPRFLTSPSGVRSRYTTEASLHVLTMAIAGRVKPVIVRHLGERGVQAVGLTGLDGRLLTARRKPAVRAVVDGKVLVVRDDRTGKITQVNANLLRLLVEAGYVPVISPPAFDPADGPVNVDADRTAAAVAAALQADHLVILSNVPGLLRDPEDASTLIPALSRSELEQGMELAQGRMKLKLIAAGEALAGGVPRVTLGDGREPSPLAAALAGAGTVLQAEKEEEGEQT